MGTCGWMYRGSSTSCGCSAKDIGQKTMYTLDGWAIRNANLGDSRKSIQANRFAEENNFHSVCAIRRNRLKTAIRNFYLRQRFADELPKMWLNCGAVRDSQTGPETQFAREGLIS